MSRDMTLMVFSMLALAPLLCQAGRIQGISQNVYPRSDFPNELGSCVTNEHCSQATSPYCSAFGYCTQIQMYGSIGCSPCSQDYKPQPATVAAPVPLVGGYGYGGK